MATVVEPILPPEGVTTARYQPLVVLLVAASAGVVLDRCWPRDFAAWWLAALVALAVWGMLLLLRRRSMALAALLFAYVAGFAAWHHAHWQLFPQDELGRRATLDIRPVCLQGTALTNVRWRPAPHKDPLRIIPAGDTCRLTLRVDAIRDGDDWISASGQAELKIEGHLVGVRAGDRVQVLALMHRVPPAANPGESDFSLHERVARQLVRLDAVSPDCVTMLTPGPRFTARRALSELRDACNQELWRRIQPERAGLASGLLIGAREQIDYEQKEQFFLTGTIHLLAISGVHVGILVAGFYLAMRTGVLGRRAAIVVAISFVMLYTALAGWQPPVVRSAILVITIGVGRMLGRPSPAMNGLAAGGLIVLALNPAELFQVGTQLSFLAVGTLIYCGPLLAVRRPADPLQRLIQESRSWPWRCVRFAWSWFWRLWLTGAVVWLVAMPLTLYHFHVLSLSALLLNSLLWVPITLALWSGFAALTIGWVIPPLGILMGRCCDANLAIVAGVVHWGEALPGSYYWLPAPPLWCVLGFYALLGLYVALPGWRPRAIWPAAILCVWIALGVTTGERMPLREHFDGEEPLACTFISVGHGTSCLLELPDGEVILYDAGHMGLPQAVADSVSAVLWSRNITHIDVLVISHADSDHYNGIPELLERFSVGAVYVSPVMFHRPSDGVEVVREAIKEKKIPLKEIAGGQRLKMGEGVACEVLHPPRRGAIGTDNANSIVLAVEYAGRRLLLPGDLERGGLADVMAEEPLPCDVVMAPHHGSASSNPRGFAAWSSPRWVVISGSRSRDATEVIDAYRSSGAEVLHTAHDGAIRFSFYERELVVETWSDYAWHVRRHRGE